MPVIAINVCKEVADYYNSLKKGTKSKHFSNVLSRHVRLSGNYDYQFMGHEQLETIIKQREEAINSLQEIITKLSTQLHEKNRSKISKVLDYILRR
tara:strand:+ start:580 stop:867 length:288 start_codon:yes stop_codon:yes gene_type:complete